MEQIHQQGARSWLLPRHLGAAVRRWRERQQARRDRAEISRLPIWLLRDIGYEKLADPREDLWSHLK